MAAPTLQAEGTLNVVTSGANAPTIPTHQAGDILVVTSIAWHPNSASDMLHVDTPASWLAGTERRIPAAGALDGWAQLFFRRAPSSGITISLARPSGWDTGTDGAWGARAYVIRSAGGSSDSDWFEAADVTAVLTAANGSVLALDVQGSERMAIHFLSKSDDFVTAPTISGWTAGTQVESGTGTDCSMGTFRKDNISADTTADASTVEAPAVGGYVFYGFSVVPIAAAPGSAYQTMRRRSGDRFLTRR